MVLRLRSVDHLIRLELIHLVDDQLACGKHWTSPFEGKEYVLTTRSDQVRYPSFLPRVPTLSRFMLHGGITCALIAPSCSNCSRTS